MSQTRREDGPIHKERLIRATPITVRRASVRIDHLRRWFAADAVIGQGRTFTVSWPGWPVKGHFTAWEPTHVQLHWEDPVDASLVTIGFEPVEGDEGATALRFVHEQLEGHPTLRERYVTWWDHYLDNLKAYCEAFSRGESVELDIQAGFKAIGVDLT